VKKEEFDYQKTLKTKPEDSFLNIQSYLYISSGQITKLLYHTSVSPHQVIFISMLFGITASYLIIQDNSIAFFCGAVLLFYKNVLDKVDGSLARAKGLVSRRGRFYDSISDFIVTLSVFTAIAFHLFWKYQNQLVFAAAYTAMICSMFQCSFFIYYQVSFIKASGKGTVNRLLEKVTEEDKKNQDKLTIFLQRLFQLIYGWQDQIIYRLDKLLKRYAYDKISHKSISFEEFENFWYGDKQFLFISSFLSIGTHVVLIAVFSMLRSFESYLFVNLILMNLLLIYCVIYRFRLYKRILKLV